MKRAGTGAQRISFRVRNALWAADKTEHEGPLARCAVGLRWSKLSADEHDLAGRSGFKDLLVCARRVGEWQFLANHGAQGSVFETGKNPGVDIRLFSRCNSLQREPANRGATPQLTGIDRDLAATAITMTRPLFAKSFVS
jgi:hypothetical protein